MTMKLEHLKKYSWRHVLYVTLISLTAWPASYLYNLLFQALDPHYVPLSMLIGGCIHLPFLYWLAGKFSSIGHDWLFCGISVFTWTCSIDLIYALELNGNISGFMLRYLQIGEPYLFSSWGFAVGIFDFIGFFPMYLAMIFLMENGKNYKWIGLYWSGGLIPNMMIEIYGALTSKSDATPSLAILLNVPYVILPIAGLFRFLSMDDPYLWVECKNGKQSVAEKVKAFTMAFCILCSMWMSMSLGFGTLGTELEVFKVVSDAVPIINLQDPAPFLKLEALIFLFYIVPIHLISLIYCFDLVKPRFLWYLALLQAGAVLSIQFDMIVSALHFPTAKEFQSSPVDLWFWLINLLIAAVPHIYIGFLSSHWTHEVRPTSILNDEVSAPTGNDEENP